MTFEDWFKKAFGTEPDLDPKSYDNDLMFKAAYEAGYKHKEEELADFYRRVMEWPTHDT